MQKNKVSISLLALFASSFALSASAADTLNPGQGMVTFDGELVGETCTIENDNLIVTLPTVSTQSMQGAGGQSGIKNFDIKVKDCPASFKKVAAHFEPIGSSGINYSTWNLKNDYQDTTGSKDAAANVEVRLFNSDHTHLRPGDTGKEVDIVGGQASMTYAGGYYATGVTTAGKVTAHVVYTLSYP